MVSVDRQRLLDAVQQEIDVGDRPEIGWQTADTLMKQWMAWFAVQTPTSQWVARVHN